MKQMHTYCRTKLEIAQSAMITNMSNKYECHILEIPPNLSSGFVTMKGHARFGCSPAHKDRSPYQVMKEGRMVVVGRRRKHNQQLPAESKCGSTYHNLVLYVLWFCALCSPQYSPNLSFPFSTPFQLYPLSLSLPPTHLVPFEGIPVALDGFVVFLIRTLQQSVHVPT